MTTTSRIDDTVTRALGHLEPLESGDEPDGLFLDLPDEDVEKQGRKTPPPVVRAIRRLIPGWFERRAWLLIVAVVAGLVGGIFYGGQTHPSYAAQVLLAVPSGATSTGPGNANDAVALALDYAAVLGNENDILAPAAQQLGIPLSELKHRITVSTETGTAVVVLKYTAPTAQDAIHGANTVATVIGQVDRANPVVPSKTLDVASFATSAARSGTIAKYGAYVGVVFGLFVGALLVLIAERVDPRADTSDDISEVFGQRTVAVPGELSAQELAYAVTTAAGPGSVCTLAPLRKSDLAEAGTFQRIVHNESGEDRASWTVSDAIEDRSAHRLPEGAVVLVVRSGERMRAVGDALERLRLMGRSLVWVMLLDRHDPVR